MARSESLAPKRVSRTRVSNLVSLKSFCVGIRGKDGQQNYLLCLVRASKGGSGVEERNQRRPNLNLVLKMPPLGRVQVAQRS